MADRNQESGYLSRSAFDTTGPSNQTHQQRLDAAGRWLAGGKPKETEAGAESEQDWWTTGNTASGSITTANNSGSTDRETTVKKPSVFSRFLSRGNSGGGT